jgi:hypothetical protein
MKKVIFLLGFLICLSIPVVVLSDHCPEKPCTAVAAEASPATHADVLRLGAVEFSFLKPSLLRETANTLKDGNDHQQEVSEVIKTVLPISSLTHKSRFKYSKHYIFKLIILQTRPPNR